MTTDRPALGRTFVDSRSLVFWVVVGLVLYGFVHLSLVADVVRQYPSISMVAGLIWLLYGLVFAFILYRLELFERRSPVTMTGALVWGAVAASGIAIVASPATNELIAKLMPESMANWASAISAGVVEEPLKMLGVVALAFIPGARINSAVDGLYYGLLVGLGFEVTESFLYGVQSASAEGGALGIVLLSFLLRGVIGGLWNHPAFTAITGAGVGYFFGSNDSLAKRATALVASLVGAIALHTFFDSPVLDEANPLVSTVVKGLPILVVLILVYRHAQKSERSLYASVGESDISSDLITGAELNSLVTRSGRRKARHAVRREAGFAAGHAARRLQRRQSDLISATIEDGANSARALEAAEDVRQAKADLELVVSGATP